MCEAEYTKEEQIDKTEKDGDDRCQPAYTVILETVAYPVEPEQPDKKAGDQDDASVLCKESRDGSQTKQ